MVSVVATVALTAFVAGFAHAATVQIETRRAEVVDPAVEVLWIPWYSDLRGKGLQIGDRIVGVQGQAYTEERRDERVGQSSEERFWKKLGLGAGDEVTLQAERFGEPIEVRARLRARQPAASGPDGKSWLSADGPPRLAKDGFHPSWMGWYADFKKKAQYVLGNELYLNFYSRRELDELNGSDWEDRVAYLEQHYPGKFAEEIRRDWDAMFVLLKGEKRELTEKDLEYRRLGEIRAAQIAQASGAAQKSFLQAVADRLVAEPFPVPEIPEGDLSGLVGKLVRLPPVGRREVILESEAASSYSFYRAGRDGQGYFFVDRRGRAMSAIRDARNRYVEKVTPEFESPRYEFIGVVGETPEMAYDIIRNRIYKGLRVKPVAATITDDRNPNVKLFLNLRAENDDEAQFAGESDLVILEVPPVTAESTPAEVVESFFESIKLSNADAWATFFADWQILSFLGPEPVVVRRNVLSENSAWRVWDASRKKLLGDVYDLEVLRTETVRRVYDGASIDGNPQAGSTVDEVTVHVVPVGRFGEEFRTYRGKVKRKWRLQRLDGGPWKLIETSPL